MNTSYEQLPDGFVERESIDLKANKKLFILVNLSARLIGAILAVGMHFIVPIQTIFSFEGGPLRFFLRFGFLLIGSFLYILLHELTHAAAMKLYGTKKIKFGFSATYAYAGSDDYYRKGPYLVIALAPVVLFAVILGVVQFLVPRDFFWVVWWIQITNLSGAAGDFYVSARFSKLPKDVLIRDYGVGMTVYEFSEVQAVGQSSAEQSDDPVQPTPPQAPQEQTPSDSSASEQ